MGERERERRECVREKEDRDVGGTERQECLRERRCRSGRERGMRVWERGGV